jgi:DNA mismatch repair protein MutS2
MTKSLELNLILEKVAHYAKTDTVKEEIMTLEPMIDRLLIERHLTETYDMLLLLAKMGHLPLIEDFDIHELIRYANMDRFFTIQELLTIRLFLLMEKSLIQYRKEAEKNRISLASLNDYFLQLHSHHSLLDYMDSKMDPDGQILDDATPELLKIRRDLSKMEKTLQDKLHHLLVDLAPYLNEHVIVIRNDRFCLPVKDAYKGKIKGVVHDMSASKQTIYIEPEATRQLTAELESLRILEEKEIQKVIALISEAVSMAKESLKDNLDLFLTFDYIQAKALYGLDIHGNKPQVNDEGTISLIKAKHPLLDPKTAVPIHVELNDEIRTLLITGPNTGGKTVALKTVGLLCLMMQCGFLIPASETSNLSIFYQIFADIGDEQSIQQSLSTFSSHMTKITQMIHQIEDKSLVLLDELGSGTDPNEGVSLAMAIINKLTTFNIRLMVTTHYSELKMYAYEKPHMATASVAFDKESLKPLYYLQMGTTGSSHAFLIARRLGLQPTVIDDALTIYQGRQTDLAKIMEKLNDEMLYLEKEKEKLSAEQEKTLDEKKHYQATREKLIAEQDELLEKIRTKEEAKWLKIREEALELIRELSTKKTLSNPEIAQLKYQLNQSIDNDLSYRINDEILVGDDVFITPYQQYGKVKAIKGDDYQVIFGKFDLSFRQGDLRKEQPKEILKKTPRPKKVDTGTTPERKASLELDLRGYRFEEVREALDQAIDRALLAGLSSMRIIHGFGSGAVRKAVYDYIKTSSYITSHRYGGEGEGLNGVTIITLK